MSFSSRYLFLWTYIEHPVIFDVFSQAMNHLAVDILTLGLVEDDVQPQLNPGKSHLPSIPRFCFFSCPSISALYFSGPPCSCHARKTPFSKRPARSNYLTMTPGPVVCSPIILSLSTYHGVSLDPAAEARFF